MVHDCIDSGLFNFTCLYDVSSYGNNKIICSAVMKHRKECLTLRHSELSKTTPRRATLDPAKDKCQAQTPSMKVLDQGHHLV